MNKTRILVVEDIIKTINGLLMELEDEYNCEIVIAGNVSDAIAELSQTHFDAMILDWRIPLEEGQNVSDDGGEAVLKALTNDNRLSENRMVPFVVATAQKASLYREQLREYQNYAGTVSKLLPDNIRILLERFFKTTGKE